MAIIAHFITNARTLEEILINFHELEGKHIGANMAKAVWKTLTCYGVQTWASSHLIMIQFTLTITPNYGIYAGQHVKQQHND